MYISVFGLFNKPPMLVVVFMFILLMLIPIYKFILRVVSACKEELTVICFLRDQVNNIKKEKISMTLIKIIEIFSIMVNTKDVFWDTFAF